jgi:hypothetical protein
LRLNALRRQLKPARRTPAGPLASPSFRPWVRRITRQEVEQSFHRSLRALGVDYIDLYLLHEAVPAYLAPDATDFVRELKACGRVRKIGVAAHGGNYAGLSDEDLEGWDVLQYEFGPRWPTHDCLRARFPGKQHILHSCLKSTLKAPPGTEARSPARVLCDCMRANPGGRVLFSSTRLEHVQQNLSLLSSC